LKHSDQPLQRGEVGRSLDLLEDKRGRGESILFRKSVEMSYDDPIVSTDWNVVSVAVVSSRLVLRSRHPNVKNPAQSKVSTWSSMW